MPDRCHVQGYAPENSVQNRLFGLAAPEKEQLRQRTSSIGRLSPLTLGKIGENGKGVNRNINPLCFNAMLLGFADAPSQSLTPRIRQGRSRSAKSIRTAASGAPGPVKKYAR